MAVDKLVDSTQLDADLTSVANAIRAKGGTSASLTFPAEFVSAISAIVTGGGAPTYGLLESFAITEGVHEFLYTVPESARGYPLYLDIDLTLSASDYIYGKMNNIGDVYSAKGTTLKTKTAMCGIVQRSISGITIPGLVAGVFGSGQNSRRAIAATRTAEFDTLRLYAYTSSVTFTGAIAIYGRVS